MINPFKNLKERNMKTLKRFLLFILFVCAASISMAQTPPHPNGGSNPNAGNTPVGGGAPIGGGLLILISLSLGYGVKKIYDFRRKALE